MEVFVLQESLFVIGGYMSVGALSSFLSYANQYTKPFNDISMFLPSFKRRLQAPQEFLIY